MANDALAPVEPPGAPSEDEYQTFCAALAASGRGRAFLAEYARRHRGADTETLLAALARLEAMMRTQARTGAEEVRSQLQGLLGSIRAASPELVEASLPARAAKLAVLLDQLERRLQALVEPAAMAPHAPPSPLAVVPPPEEPQLPLPTPDAAQPALALAHERAPAPLPQTRLVIVTDGKAAIPEVSWFDSAPVEPVAAEIASTPLPPAEILEAAPAQATPSPTTVRVQSDLAPGRTASAALSPSPFADGSGASPESSSLPVRNAPVPSPFPQGGLEPVEIAAHSDPTSTKLASANSPAAHEPPPPDPLAVLMALSDEERIALFT